MATSSKVRFNLEGLRAEALRTLDMRIAHAEVVVASYEDDEALLLRTNDWRERQVAKVRTLAQQLDEDESSVDNHRLSQFSLDPIPSVDKWERRDAERRLDDLYVKRAQVAAKAGSITPDEDGSVSLTKTQLTEFFGL
jgi:hypothetical protein